MFLLEKAIAACNCLRAFLQRVQTVRRCRLCRAACARTACACTGSACTAVAALLLLPGSLAAQHPGGAASRSDAPLMKLLPRFESPSVPAMSAQEVEPPNAYQGAPQPAGLPGNGAAQHPMLYIGEGYNKMFLVDRGKVVWTYATGPGNEYDDVWMLSNGNILFTRMQYIAEITPEKKVVWRFDAPAGTEIHACQPIGLDKVLFVVNGLPPRLMVVNIRTGATEVQHVLPAISETDRSSVHAQFRRVRYTAQGTYLLPFLEMNRVVEYDKNFHEIWSYDIPKPWAAIRLPNGNTLITDESDVLTREVNPKKETVWQVSRADIPAEYWYGNSQSVTRLANGNTIICSRGGDNHGPQLVEVTPGKKVVWVLRDWKDFGPATAVQILDEPGIPEHPGDSLH